MRTILLALVFLSCTSMGVYKKNNTNTMRVDWTSLEDTSTHTVLGTPKGKPYFSRLEADVIENRVNQQGAHDFQRVYHGLNHKRIYSIYFTTPEHFKPQKD